MGSGNRAVLMAIRRALVLRLFFVLPLPAEPSWRCFSSDVHSQTQYDDKKRRHPWTRL
jgi:hypothetical protein